jgi:hypothetical protein
MEKHARYSEVYDAYEKGMKEIKDIFLKRLKEKEDLQIVREVNQG